MLSWIVQTPYVGAGIAAFLAVAALAVFIVYSTAEAQSLRVVQDVLERRDLPQRLDGVRIVFISDVHAGPFFGRRSMNALVDRVNALKPDILLLGGDNVGGRAGGARVFYPAACRFNARLAKVAVLGNHDFREGADRARSGLADAGFAVLENDNVSVNAADGSPLLRVGGLEDPYAGNPDADKAARGIDPSEFAILVSHNPDAFADLPDDETRVWDLALAGHTHSGQITFFGRWAPTSHSAHGQRFLSGWSKSAGGDVLVSRGVGTVTVPLRFFAPPEINVITLKRV